MDSSEVLSEESAASQERLLSNCIYKTHLQASFSTERGRAGLSGAPLRVTAEVESPQP